MEALHIVYHMLPDSKKMYVNTIEVTNENTYNARTGRLTVSHFVVMKGNTSIAKAIVAHEAGHIQQNLWWYGRFNQLTVALWALCFTVGFFYPTAFIYAIIAIITNWLSVIIIEANASYRAYTWLKAQRCANMKIVKKLYIDALFSYIKPF